MHRSGFTLLELLVSIAIIFVLLGTALVALRAARGGADRATTLNALRQVMTGFAGYSTEHNGRILPGYIDPPMLGTDPLTQLDIRAKRKDGVELSAADAAGYVWRLAPYLNNGYATVLADYSRGLRKRFEDEYASGVYGPGTAGPNDLGIGRFPSIGYNSIYLGGDNVHVQDYFCPWESPNPNVLNDTRAAALRMSEVGNPARTIGFASCRAWEMPVPDVGEQLGYVELHPPYIPEMGFAGIGPEWWINEDNQLQPWPRNNPGPVGMMVDRSEPRSDNVPTARLDGSVTTVQPASFIPDPTLPMNAKSLFMQKAASQWAPYYATLSNTPP